MKFFLNSQEYISAEPLNIEKLLALEEIDYKSEAMTVKLNGEFVSMKTYESTFIKENDDVWVVLFSPGG